MASSARHVVRRDVVKETLGDGEMAPADLDLGRALGRDRRHRGCEQVAHVRRLGRRGDGCDAARLGYALGGGEHRRTAEAVPDQECRRPVVAAQVVGGRDQVVDVGGESSVGEVALATAKPGEVEA